MAKVVLSKDTPAANIARRNQLKPGTVFRAVLKGGLGKNTYVALANNGKHYSLNLGNGQLASTENATRAAYCKAGIPTEWNTYPGDHILADTEAIGDVMNWFAGRFAGLPAASNC